MSRCQHGVCWRCAGEVAAGHGVGPGRAAGGPPGPAGAGPGPGRPGGGGGRGRGGARLTGAGAGYRLGLGPGELDVAVFGTLAARGRDAARSGDAAAARELFETALGLWRGAALGDAAPLCARLAGEAHRLEELRLAVAQERAECDLTLGRHGEVAGDLAGLVAEFPLRERLAVLLMIALYRCGRRGGALAGFDTARRGLGEPPGPGPGAPLPGPPATV